MINCFGGLGALGGFGGGGGGGSGLLIKTFASSTFSGSAGAIGGGGGASISTGGGGGGGGGGSCFASFCAISCVVVKHTASTRMIFFILVIFLSGMHAWVLSIKNSPA